MAIRDCIYNTEGNKNIMIRATKKILKILNTRQKKIMVILAVMMFIGGLVESLSVSLMLPLLTAVMDASEWQSEWYAVLICDIFHINGQRDYVVCLLLILIAVFVLKNAYLIAEYHIQYGFITRSRVQLQHDLMRRYMHKPYEYYLNSSTGEIVRIVTSDTNHAFELMTSLLSFYTEIIVSIMLGITVTIMSWQIGTGMIIILLIELIIIAKIIKPILRRQGNIQRRDSGLANKWLLQAINGIKSIKVSNREQFFEEKYGKHADMAAVAEKKQKILYVLPRLIIEAFTVTGVLIMLLIMVLAGTSLASIVPLLSAFVMAAIRLLPSVNRISAAMTQVSFYEGGLDNVIRTLELEDEIDARTPIDIKTDICLNDAGAVNKQVGIAFFKEILFDGITFAYPNSDKNVLENACFSIVPGQSIGIIGSSGAGKTTAMDILLGLLEPQSGRVLVDGVDITKDMAAWHELLAYIPQSIFLMDDTIRENVAFGMSTKDIDDERVWQALSDAQLKELVENMPEGLDTVIGEAGIRLSGGQRQRLGIARALYNNPQILFFDEATSALDNETEAAIMDSINSLKGKKTLIIIAHRLTTIENCDTVYRVGNGKVVRER